MLDEKCSGMGSESKYDSENSDGSDQRLLFRDDTESTTTLSGFTHQPCCLCQRAGRWFWFKLCLLAVWAIITLAGALVILKANMHHGAFDSSSEDLHHHVAEDFSLNVPSCLYNPPPEEVSYR